MTLTELRYIVAVAEHRHFGKAAAACFVSQPTLSVGVRKLEEELGVRLFERSRSDVIVTPDGAPMIEQAKTVLRAADALREMAEAAQDPLGQRLVLGVIYTIGSALIPRLIGALKKRAPQLELIVRENFTDQLVAELASGGLDCAIMSPPVDDTRLVSRALYEEPFKVILPRDHALARQRSVNPAALTNETLLLLGARNCFRDQVLEVCPACVVSDQSAESLQRTLEGSSLDTICQMVATGAGVTVVPQLMPLNEALAEHVAERPFTRPAPTRTISVYYRRGFARPALINCLAEVVRAARLKGVRYCA